MSRWWMFGQKQAENDVEEEIRFHIEQETQLRIGRGESPATARRIAHQTFGSVLRTKEDVRAAWGWQWLEAFVRDCHYGVRMLGRSPGSTAAAILSLTLGIGASCAIFSVLHALLLAPLPFQNPEELVAIAQSHPRMPKGYKSGTSLADLTDWRAQSKAFQDFAASDWIRHHLEGGTRPANASALRVTESFFPMLGTAPALGRTLMEEDFRYSRKVVVLSHQLWNSRFNADQHIIGKSILLDSQPYEVAGVMPPQFRFPPGAPQVPGMTCQLWEPLLPTNVESTDRSYRSADIWARLSPGASLAAARTELRAILARQAQSYPATNEGWTAEVTSLAAEATANLRSALLLLTASVFLVLLIACANVSNLLLARSAARVKEFGLRTALGAGRMRLLSQTVAENLALAVLGGATGLLTARWALQAIVPFFPHNVPRIDEIGIAWPVVIAAVSFTLFAATTTAVAPALALWRVEPAQAFHWHTASTRRLTRGWLPAGDTFVIAQVAVSLVLLVGAGLMIRTLSALQDVDLGFRPNAVLTIRISPPRHIYNSWQQVRQFQQRLLSDIEGRPGVASAALAMTLPLSGRSVKTSVAVQSSGIQWNAERNVVSSGYFETMRIPLAGGRTFTTADTIDSPPVAVINRSLARQLWPDAGSDSNRAVGKAVYLAGRPTTVVGLVDNEKHWAIDREAEPKIYLPYLQDSSSQFLMSILTFLVVRTSDGEPARFATPVRQTVWSIDKSMPVDDIQTMRQLVDNSIALPRFRALLLGALALIALLISLMGVYSVLAYAVTRRSRDIGIQMALGAGRSRVLRAILLDGMRLALLGTAIGLGLAAVLTSFLRNQLYAVRPLDMWTFTAAAALMLTVALVACLVPAHAATRVDPLAALRDS